MPVIVNARLARPFRATISNGSFGIAAVDGGEGALF
jgi:hypothetical protein